VKRQFETYEAREVNTRHSLLHHLCGTVATPSAIKARAGAVAASGNCPRDSFSRLHCTCSGSGTQHAAQILLPGRSEETSVPYPQLLSVAILLTLLIHVQQAEEHKNKQT